MNVGPLTFAHDNGAILQPRTAVGASLMLAVNAVLTPPPSQDGRGAVTRFGAAMLHLSAPATPEPVPLDLGSLGEVTRRMPDAVTRGFSSPAWAVAVLHRLRESAAPVLGRQQPMTDHAATVIRVPALVLAAEAVLAQQDALAADLRRLAAATCLMRSRAEDASLLETIILATT
jgi:hypothetical protein